MDQRKTPLFDQLLKHQEKMSTSFHVPGHKNGAYFHEKGLESFKHILEIDLTEISGMDDLHSPTTVIKEAQDLTANLYNVSSSYFLIGGSTVGNLAMIMNTVSDGDKLLIQRNCHQSVFHAVELSGAKPIYIEPEVDVNTGLSLGIPASLLEEAIMEHPQAKGIVLTSPTYEGYAQPLHYHVKMAHEAGMLVLVDEAHGAHLITEGDRWPISAIKSGADIVVQSAHKMLPAMTMASYLHVNSGRVDTKRLQHYLRMLQSSSPSYPLMASLDLARAYLFTTMQSGLHPLIEQISSLRKRIGEGQNYQLSPEKIGPYIQDPLKLVFLSKAKAVELYWQKRLEENHAYPELVSPNHLLLTLPLTNETLPLEAWEELIKKSFHDKGTSTEKLETNYFYGNKEGKIIEPILTIKEVDSSVKKRVQWREAIGQVVAETITPYPPGIPLLIKGEVIKGKHLIQLEELVLNNMKFQTGDAWKTEGISVVNNR